MCGRFALYAPASRIAEIFDLIEPVDLSPRYNIAPTDQIPIVVASEAGRKLGLVRWGLQPFFLQGKSGPPLINARAETLLQKPMFRRPLAQQRCLVPADAFYEWERVGKERKPWMFAMRDDSVFAMAGLWESTRDEDGARKGSVAVITTGSNSLVGKIHDRMPAIVHRDDWSAWLDRDNVDPEPWIAKLVPFPAEAMIARRVDPRVNNVKNDDLACIAPFAG